MTLSSQPDQISGVSEQIWSLRGVRKEVIDYAHYLGMSLPQDAHLLWIAEKGINAELPDAWRAYEDEEGHPYFHCSATDETSWTHPRDVEFWQMYHDHKAMERENASKAPASQPRSLRALAPSLEPRPPSKPRTAPSNQPHRRKRCPRPHTSRTSHQKTDVHDKCIWKSNRTWRDPWAESRPTSRHECSREPWHGMEKEVVSAADKNIRPGTADSEHPAHDAHHETVPLALGKMHPPSRAMQREFIKAIKARMDGIDDPMVAGILPPRLPHLASLVKREAILRPHHSLIWQKPPERTIEVQQYKPKKAFYAKKLSENEFSAEIDQVAAQVGLEIPRDQIELLYKAFRRQTEDAQFTREEWSIMMEKIGLNREEVAHRIFDTWAKGQVYARTLSYKPAVFALCALGVGCRAMQAEAVFRSCDKNHNGEVSRGEMLAFVTDQNPFGKYATKKSKSQAFAAVGKLFDLMKVRGKEEVPMSRFVAVIADDDEVFHAFQQINPYRKYFLSKGQTWDTTDFSLQNVLNALFLHSDAAESAAALADRVDALGRKIDADNSGYLDNQEILDALIALGYDQDDAVELAAKECGPKGMPMKKFVMVFTEIAQVNLTQFEAVEKKYGLKDREAQLEAGLHGTAS